MASWTQADADKLQAAIVALACGEAVQTVSFNGPPARTVTYMPRDLKTMQTLLAQMNASLRSQSNAYNYSLVATSKGLR